MQLHRRIPFRCLHSGNFTQELETSELSWSSEIEWTLNERQMSYTYLTTYSVGKHQQRHRTKNYILLSARTETTENLQPIGRRRHQASGWGTLKFIKWYKRTGTITWKPGSGGSSKLTREIKQLIESNMRVNDETTAMQLHQILTSRGYNLSKRTILRCRSTLGWTFRGITFCQLISEANKEEHLCWALQYQHEADGGFQDVLWTDECSVQLKHIEGFAVGRGKAA